jgi:hypothetical protein
MQFFSGARGEMGRKWNKTFHHCTAEKLLIKHNDRSSMQLNISSGFIENKIN